MEIEGRVVGGDLRNFGWKLEWVQLWMEIEKVHG